MDEKSALDAKHISHITSPQLHIVDSRMWYIQLNIGQICAVKYLGVEIIRFPGGRLLATGVNPVEM